MAASSSGKVAERKKHSFLVNFLIRLVKEKPLGTVGLVITLLLLFVGIFADFIAPYGMNESHGVENYLAAPSAKFWLGTDSMGRDVLTRIIFGARVSMIVGLSSAFLGMIISTALGILSGYIGGKFDLIMQRFVDAWMCLPGLIVLMLVMNILGRGMLPLIIAMGVFGAIGGSRVKRSAVIAIKENVYVQAAVAIGCSRTRILIRHILPNIMGVVIIGFTMGVPGFIMQEASLSFLGFGIPAPNPSWGGMISTSKSVMFEFPWLIIFPGLALAIVVYGVNMFGDAMRDILDPRLRGGVGRFGIRAEKPKVKSETRVPEGLTNQ